MTVRASQSALENQSEGAPQKESVVIRFAGDSGDGMQITGSLFTHNSALVGYDISTLPDFPAEIRAPAGTLPGVSGFQLNFSSLDIRTPGDEPEALVALNPAALKTNLPDLIPGGLVIVNADTFRKNNLVKAGYETDPREDHSLDGYTVVSAPITSLTQKAVEPAGLTHKEGLRSKNMFALGIVHWIYDRPLDKTISLLQDKFKKKPQIFEANKLALTAGYNYAETTELLPRQVKVTRAKMPPGKYRMMTGNQATAMGFVAASQLSTLPLFYGSYPITPASDILHELSRFRGFGVKTFQAEDEIAAMASVVGAAFSGALALTGTSGPGLALKSEALGLAVMTELPVVVVNVQRGGPSTGLPTKTEQADLLQALFGRNGECPVAVVAPATPGDCFHMAIEATRIAIRHMCPVIFLSDGYLANGAEPWIIPRVADLPSIEAKFRSDGDGFLPYLRNEDTLARPWATPGTAGLEHRVGGLEKQDGSGNVNYDPHNHEHMVKIRAEKIERIANFLPPTEVFGDEQGDVLVIGWGSTYGAITSAVERVQSRGGRVSSVHLRHLNPLPSDLGDLMARFGRILVPEMNMGQLSLVLRARYLVDTAGLNKIQGQPFKVSEIEARIEELL